jgi:hypothetical protein
MKLSVKCILAYRDQFDDNCFFAEPSDLIMVEDPQTKKYYISTYTETEEEFMDRLKRSQEAQRNLFFEEWEEHRIVPGMMY